MLECCGVSWLDPGLLLWIVSMAEDGLPKIRQSGKACLVPGWLCGLCLLLLAEAHESGLQTRLGPARYQSVLQRLGTSPTP